MEKRSSIRKVQFRCAQARFYASIKRTLCESRELETACPQAVGFCALWGKMFEDLRPEGRPSLSTKKARSFWPRAFNETAKMSSRGRFEHRQHWCALDVRRRNSFKVRADTAKFCIQECVDKMQTAIKPCKHLVFDLVVNSQCNLSAMRSDFGEIDQSHQVDITAH